MARGNATHKEAEQYLMGVTKELPPALSKFATLAADLRDMNPIVEAEWGYTREWKPCEYRDWKNCWFRAKLDVAVVYGDGTALAGDWKTGKAYSTHADQMELFGLAIMRRYPVKSVEARLWYTDTGQEDITVIAAKDRENIERKWEQRVGPLFADTRFAPKPSAKCRWCAFSKGAGGPCKAG